MAHYKETGKVVTTSGTATTTRTTYTRVTSPWLSLGAVALVIVAFLILDFCSRSTETAHTTTAQPTAVQSASCDARFQDYIANIDSVNDKYATLVALCPAELTRENNLIIVKAFEENAKEGQKERTQ
jgi:hypothetical protein